VQVYSKWMERAMPLEGNSSYPYEKDLIWEFISNGDAFYLMNQFILISICLNNILKHKIREL
jgi:hypothetical protein